MKNLFIVVLFFLTLSEKVFGDEFQWRPSVDGPNGHQCMKKSEANSQWSVVDVENCFFDVSYHPIVQNDAIKCIPYSISQNIILKNDSIIVEANSCPVEEIQLVEKLMSFNDEFYAGNLQCLSMVNLDFLNIVKDTFGPFLKYIFEKDLFSRFGRLGEALVALENDNFSLYLEGIDEDAEVASDVTYFPIISMDRVLGKGGKSKKPLLVGAVTKVGILPLIRLAMKQNVKNPEDALEIRRDAKILQRLQKLPGGVVPKFHLDMTRAELQLKKPYYIAEFFDGGDIRQGLEDTPLPQGLFGHGDDFALDKALDMVQQLSSKLNALGKAGILITDLKPPNILKRKGGNGHPVYAYTDMENAVIWDPDSEIDDPDINADITGLYGVTVNWSSPHFTKYVNLATDNETLPRMGVLKNKQAFNAGLYHQQFALGVTIINELTGHLSPLAHLMVIDKDEEDDKEDGVESQSGSNSNKNLLWLKYQYFLDKEMTPEHRDSLLNFILPTAGDPPIPPKIKEQLEKNIKPVTTQEITSPELIKLKKFLQCSLKLAEEVDYQSFQPCDF